MANHGQTLAGAPPATPHPARDLHRLRNLSLDRVRHQCRRTPGSLGRLMRHVLLSLPVAPRPPRMGEAARSRALVAPACFPLGLTPGLIPARLAAVPLAAVAVAAHQDLRLAAGPRTPIRPSRPRGASCSAAGPRSRPTHVAPPAPVPTAPVALAVPKRWTNAVRRCNTSGALCSARWGAVAQATATSFGRRTRLDAQASIVLPLSGLLAQDPPAQPPPPTARNARPSCSSTTAAGLSTAAGGRRIRRTNDRRRGQVVFTATTSRQAAQRPTAAYSVTKIPAGDGSASVSETRVNFRERQRFRERGKPHCPPVCSGAWAGKPQGDLLGEGVWDRGKSERPAVIAGTGVQDLPRCESRPTSTWCNRREPVAEFYQALKGCTFPFGADVRVLDG